MVSSSAFDPSALTAKQVTQIHRNADTDGSTKAIHHTIGPGPSQAAAGNHTHDGGQSALVDAASLNAQIVPWIAVSAFLNTWSNYGGVFPPAGYRKVGDIVYLRGMVKGGTFSSTTTGNIFVLPTGYWAPFQHVFSAICSGGAARVDAFPDGSIRAYLVYVSGGTNAYISLEGIQFSVTA